MNEESLTESAVTTPQSVDVFSPTGEYGEIPAHALTQAISEGYRVASPEEVRKRTLEKTYGDRDFAAAAAGAARGLSFGTSDIFLPATGLVERETLQGLKEVNPTASMIGEGVGIVAPALLSGGTSLAGSVAAKTAPGLVARGGAALTGRVAETALIKQLAKTGATKVAQKALSKAIPAAAGAAAEGFAYGVGQEISEEALGDPEFSAEALISEKGLSNLLKGGLKGALGGAAIAGGLAAAPAVIKPITKPLLDKFAKETDDIWNGVKGSAAIRAAGAQKRQINELARKGRKVIEATDEEIEKAINEGTLSNLEKYLSGKEVVGRDLIEEGVIPEKFWGTTIEESNKVAKERASVWGKQIGSTLKEADEALMQSGKTLNADEVLSRVRSDVVDKLKLNRLPQFRAVGERLDETITSALSGGEKLSLQEIHKVRSDIDDLINYNRADTGQLSFNKELVKVRRSLENITEESMKGASPDLLKRYQTAKQKFSSMKWALDTTNNRIATEAANRFLSPSDQGWAAAVALGSTVLRGFDPATLAIGLLAGATNRIARKRGGSIIAGTMSKIESLGAVAKARAALDKNIAGAVTGFLESKGQRIVAPLSVKALGSISDRANDNDDFDSIRDELTHLAQSPEDFDDKISSGLGGLYNSSPKAATHIAQKAGSAFGKMQEYLPKHNREVFDITGTSEFMPSDVEMAKFRRVRAAAENPVKVLQEMATGQVDPDSIQTIKDLYPAMFAKLQQTMVEKLSEKKEKLPYQKRLMISRVLQIPIDDSMTNKMISSLQANFQDGGPQGMPMTKPNKPSRTMNTISAPSNIDRATYR